MTDHPTIEELARLAEGAIAGPEHGRMIEHLSECRSCMAAYADAVRYRTAFLACPEAFAAPPHYARNSPVDPNEPGLSPGGGLSRRRPGRRLSLPFAAAAGLAVAIAVIVAVRNPRQSISPVSSPIRMEVDRASRNTLILPGARPFDGSFPVLRDGDIPNPAASVSIDSLAGLYQDGRLDPAATRWMIAGMIASGDLRRADDYLERLLADNQHDAEFLELAGIVAYKENDLPLAEDYLQRSLERDSRSETTRFNLGWILVESHRTREAAPLLRSLARSSDTLVRSRTIALLDSISPGTNE